MSEQYVTLAEVKELLAEENEKRSMMNLAFNSTQKAAMMHAQAVTKDMTKEKTDALIAELSELSFVTETTSYKIADLLPKYPEEVRAIFSKERINLEVDDINKIIDIVNKYI